MKSGPATARTLADKQDVIIAGGGPAGLYAAACLASEGIKVKLVEEHNASGQPVHCTGVLGVEAYKEFRLPKKAILNELTKVRFYSPSGHSFDYATDPVEALVVDRQRFDHLLFELAKAAGAEITLGSRVSAITVEPSHVTVHCSGTSRPLQARACILACGANYTLQRRLGLGFPAVYLSSAQIEAPAAAEEHVELHFGDQVAPRGFAWLVPVKRGAKSCARVGLICEGKAAPYFERFLDRIGQRWGIATEPGVTPRQKIVPLSPIQKTYGRRLLVIGDAAGLVKPTTGGGIYYSIVSAAIAAEVLLEALRRDDLSESALRDYEVRWQQRLGTELQSQLTLRSLAVRLTDPEIEALFELAKTDGLMPLIRKTAKFNYHRKLIVALLKHQESRKILFRHLVG